MMNLARVCHRKVAGGRFDGHAGAEPSVWLGRMPTLSRAALGRIWTGEIIDSRQAPDYCCMRA